MGFILSLAENSSWAGRAFLDVIKDQIGQMDAKEATAGKQLTETQKTLDIISPGTWGSQSY